MQRKGKREGNMQALEIQGYARERDDMQGKIRVLMVCYGNIIR